MDFFIAYIVSMILFTVASCVFFLFNALDAYDDGHNVRLSVSTIAGVVGVFFVIFSCWALSECFFLKKIAEPAIDETVIRYEQSALDKKIKALDRKSAEAEAAK